MSNSKTTRQENLNKYVDMLHRQNVSGEQPKPGEVKITKPFEETGKETKMTEQQTELESMSMEDALNDPELAALSANVLKECYELIRLKISDNLLDEWKAEITEECTDESMTALRRYLATLSKEETQELVSDVVKELVDSQLFDTINSVVKETEEKLEESDEKVDLIDEAKKAIEKKAAELEEKANSEETSSESEDAEAVVKETEQESPCTKGFGWPMDKFSEIFPG